MIVWQFFRFDDSQAPVLREEGTAMKFLSALLLAALIGAAALPALAAGDIVGYAPGRLLLQLTPQAVELMADDGVALKAGPNGLTALADRFRVSGYAPMYAGVRAPDKAGAPDLRLHWRVDFPESVDLDEAKRAFEALPEVDGVWKDAALRSHALPNDIHPSQWYLRNMNLGGTDVRWVGGWAEAQGDSSIVVAVLDTGVDWDHPDLGGPHPDHVNGAVKTNWTEYYGTPGVDDDGNGYIDDIRGWDFVNSPGEGAPGEDDAVRDNDPADFDGHGTNCSGIIGAIAGNGLGIAGTAAGCKILPVRIGFRTASGQGIAYVSTMSTGMIFAAQNGADIINLSYGTSSFLNWAMQTCAANGVMVFNSAGNDDVDTPDYLGTHPDAISVAATSDGDAKATFSNYGTWVEMSAPGVAMYTTNPTGGYESVQGTSFSCPLAAGAAALIWSAHPTWTGAQVQALMESTCDNIDAANPSYVGLLGAGRLNLLRALGDNVQEMGSEFEFFLDAFNEAAPGDIIAVPASYPVAGPMVVPAKELLVYGGYDDTFTSRDPVNTPTVITANATNTALQVSGGATASLVIDGFRCTGGGGKFYNGIPLSGYFGGGVVLNNTSPTLRNIEVTGNGTGGVSQVGGGGGVLLLNSSAVLENVNVHGNTSMFGAGLFISGGAPVLRGCTVADNVTNTSNGSVTPLGGGIYAVDTSLTMENCSVSGHGPVDRGGGIYAHVNAGSLSLDLTDTAITGNQAKTRGGGLYQTGGALTMSGGAVSDNANTPDATFMFGGGVCVENAAVDLSGLEILGNASQNGGGLYVGTCSSFDLTDSVVAGNTGLFLAGAMSLQSTAAATLTGVTVADNYAASAGGGLYMAATPATLANTLIAFNRGNGAASNGIDATGAVPALSCCDVYGNDGNQFSFADPTGSNGNVSADPLFCDLAGGVLTLYDSSPCLPASSGGCGQIGALGQGCTSGSSVDPGAAPAAFRVEPNYPNPFNPSTTIEFALPARSHVSVKIFDVSGRLVRTLVDGVLDAQIHQAVWTGDDDGGRQVSSGVYFYRVETESEMFVSRMALLK